MSLRQLYIVTISSSLYVSAYFSGHERLCGIFRRLWSIATCIISLARIILCLAVPGIVFIVLFFFSDIRLSKRALREQKRKRERLGATMLPAAQPVLPPMPEMEEINRRFEEILVK